MIKPNWVCTRRQGSRPRDGVQREFWRVEESFFGHILDFSKTTALGNWCADIFVRSRCSADPEAYKLALSVASWHHHRNVGFIRQPGEPHWGCQLNPTLRLALPPALVAVPGCAWSYLIKPRPRFPQRFKLPERLPSWPGAHRRYSEPPKTACVPPTVPIATHRMRFLPTTSRGYLRSTSVVPPFYVRSTSVWHTEVLRT